MRLRVRQGVTAPESHPVPVRPHMTASEPQPARERQREQGGEEEGREDWGSPSRHCAERGAGAAAEVEGERRRWEWSGVEGSEVGLRGDK